jgi:hypothetical protein
MTQTIAGRFLGGAVRLVDILHVRWALTGFVHRLPPSARLRLGRLQVRTGYMHGLTLVPEHALQQSYETALRLIGLDRGKVDGVYLEFGVFVGTTMSCMYQAAVQAHVSDLRLIGFDSFQGMPEGVELQDDQRWSTGQLYADLPLARSNLERLGVDLDRIELVPGWFEDTLTDEGRRRLGLARVDVVMIDCVLSTSARLALDFCTPLIGDRAIIYFDDWAAAGLADRGMGERAAFEAWLAAHPEMVASEIESLRYNDDARAFMVDRMPVAEAEDVEERSTPSVG